VVKEEILISAPTVKFWEVIIIMSLDYPNYRISDLDYQDLWEELKSWLESISDVDYVDDEVIEDSYLRAIEAVYEKMLELEEERVRSLE
jgi:hypothetical protein